MLFQVKAPHFTAGIVVNARNLVVASAPILAWTRGRDWGWVKGRFRRSGWSWNVVGTGGGDVEGRDDRADREADQ